MFVKKFRLRKNKDFERVWQKGEGYFLKEIGLKVKENDLDIPRFGFIVSKKISKKAVVRNKIKRRIRAIIREFFSEIIEGYDYVFFARPGIENLDFEELKDKVKILFNKLAKIKK